MSQVSVFLGRRIFLKIRVFLRLLFFISSISSFITVTSSLRTDIWFFDLSIWKSLLSFFSGLFFIFDRLDLPMLIALVSTFLTKSISSSRWFLIYSSTEPSLFSMLTDVDSISFLISLKLHSWSLLVFDGKGGTLVFESSFGPFLFNYNKNISKSVTFD